MLFGQEIFFRIATKDSLRKSGVVKMTNYKDNYIQLYKKQAPENLSSSVWECVNNVPIQRERGRCPVNLDLFLTQVG